MAYDGPLLASAIGDLTMFALLMSRIDALKGLVVGWFYMRQEYRAWDARCLFLKFSLISVGTLLGADCGRTFK